MMLYLILIIVGLIGAGALALVSEAFTRELSRIVEAAFDTVEYRLALRAERRQERLAQTEQQHAFEVNYATRARVSL